MTTPLPSRKDFKALNVIGLLRDSLSVGHAVLMEGIDGGTADNMTGVGGVHAVVVKSQNMRMGKLFGWAGSNNNVIFKSDSYAPCGNISVDYIEALRNPPNCTPWFTPAIATFGFQTNPATASFTGPLQIGTIKTLGAGNGWCITGGPSNVLADVQVDKLIADGFTGTMSAGVNFYGTRAMRVQIAEMIVNNASQGLAWNPATSGDNTQHQISIGSAKFTNTSVRAVNASGNARVRIGTLEVATAPQAYYIDDGARLMIGKETLIAVTNKWERAGRPALATGWADFGGGASTFDVILENYGVSIKGLLTASAGSTGILANVPAYLRPTQGKRLPGSLTKASVPGFGQIGVSTGGAIDINNNTTQANGDYVSVDGVNWQHW